MITRALVISKVYPDNEYLWYVNIPILHGVPDNQVEADSYKNLLRVNIENNEKLKIEALKTRPQVALVTSDLWGDSNENINDSRFSRSAYLPDFEYNISKSEFVTQARLCGIRGMKNLIHPGDTVIVGFEDNDMGSPIILGHLLTQQLETPIISPELLPVANFSVTNASESALLPFNTTFTLANGSTITMRNISLLWDFYVTFIERFPTGLTGLLASINTSNNDSDETGGE